VLKGVDAVVFVADSSRAKLDENLESLRNLEQNLNEHGLSLDDLPWVIQYNKRDLPDALPVAELEARLNPFKKPSFEAVANKGTGVYETFHGIATMVYRVLKDRLEKGDLATEVGGAQPAMEAKRATRPQAATPPAPARPARPTPPPAQAPAPPQRTASPPAAEANDGGFEFDDHVDMMLREVDTPTRATPAKPAAPAPAKGRPAAPAPPTRAQAPGTLPKPRRLGDVAPGKTPAHAPGEPAHAEAPGDDLFASIPSSPFDHELGRVPALDEASIASEEARAEGPDEFVTDPMRRTEPKPAPAPAAPAPPPPQPPREVRLGPASAARESRIATDPNAQDTRELRVAAGARKPTSTVDEVRIEVPVMLSRSQLDSGAPIRIVLNVKVLDD
jgi:hypothetical protein